MGEIPNYKVERPIYSYDKFSNDYIEEEKPFDILKSLNYESKLRNITFSSVFRYVIPFPFIMASFYTLKFLFNDIVAGLTMLIFHIPQGMAFGLLSGVQPINGLYTSFFPPIIYFLFGTSRHISVGTFSIMSLLSSVPVIREAKSSNINLNNLTTNSSDSEMLAAYELSKLEITIATALLAGLIQLIMGLCQFGCIMNYVNDTLIGGFTTATAFHIILSQLESMLGYSIIRYSGVGELPYKMFLFFTNFKRVHMVTFSISVSCILILLLFTVFINPIIKKKFDIPFPIQLILVIILTIISYYVSLNGRFSVKIVGFIPKGFPSLKIPDVKIWPRITMDAVLLAVFAFVMNCSLAKLYSVEFNYSINFNQELVAYGCANIFGSFFQCMVSASAMTRTAVVVDVGMKSQLASLISCVIMMFVLLFLGPLFEPLPKCVLATIIVVSLKGIVMQIKELPKLYNLSKLDFDVWVVSFLATILLNVPFGLLVGFIFSLMTVYMRFHNPKSIILGRLENTNIYKNKKTFKDAIEIPGIKIFRYESPIYFANAEDFREKLYKKCELNPGNFTDLLDSPNADVYKVHNEKSLLMPPDKEIRSYQLNTNLKFIILDFSPVNYVDNVSIRILNDIYKLYREIGIFIYIAEPNNRVRKLLLKAGFAKDDLNNILFVSIHDAVLKILSIMIQREQM